MPSPRTAPAVHRILIAFLLPAALLLILALLAPHAADAQGSEPGGSIPLPVVPYWTVSLIDGENDTIADFDATADSTGKLHVVYVVKQRHGDLLRYAAGEPGAWEISTLYTATLALGDSYLAILAPSIVVDEEDKPLIAFHHGPFAYGSRGYFLARWSGASWSIESVGALSNDSVHAHNLKLVLTQEGNPMIVTTEFQGEIGIWGEWLTSFELDGVWKEHPIAWSNVAYLHASSDADGAPCIFHSNDYTGISPYPFYMRCFRAGAWTEPLSVSLDSPYVGFRMNGAGEAELALVARSTFTEPRRLLHGRLTGEVWVTTTIEPAENSIEAADMATMPGDRPAVIYRKDIYNSTWYSFLRFGTMGDDDVWRTESVVSGEQRYFVEPNLVVADGTPHVVYRIANQEGIFIARRHEIQSNSEGYLPLVGR